jgi:hypothetical protein
MELHRMEQICKVVEDGLDAHAGDPAALSSFLGERHVTQVDVLEALEDVGRFSPEHAQTAGGLLRMAAEQLASARG